MQLGPRLPIFHAAGGPTIQVVIGKDYASSGLYVESALTRHLFDGRRRAACGSCRRRVIAFLTRSLRADAGVISASHNPYQDNGIKFFFQ